MKRTTFFAYMPYSKADGGPFLRRHGPYVFSDREQAERVVRRIPGGRVFGSIVPVHIVPVRQRKRR